MERVSPDPVDLLRSRTAKAAAEPEPELEPEPEPDPVTVAPDPKVAQLMEMGFGPQAVVEGALRLKFQDVQTAAMYISLSAVL